ncbi:NAD-dependent epimerase/dehydratase family protein [Pseudorhizobium banfieldiae]|nr:NAD(P)-dependent oxidoreductase [Pseudorhizobium banfieldiae]CAD6615971.1 NAD(P)-dependent oxidoreductase [arsenite-oxidising bacterium NT-25]
MRVQVSGGAGLVGRYIVNGLLGAGHEVVVGGRTAPPPDWFVNPVPFVPLSLDPDLDQRGAFAGIDAFVHAAFDHLPGRYRGGEGGDPERFRRLNLHASTHLFEQAKAAGVRRTIFLSSRAVYDGIPPGQKLDENAFLSPTSLYGQVKLEAERALARLEGPGFVTSSLRLTGVYGELRPNKWDDLIADYLAGRPVFLRAGSEVHGQDVAQAVRLMIESDANLVRGAFNISDIVTDTRTILEPVQRIAGSIHPLPREAETAQVAVMSTDRIRSLGWEPGGFALLAATAEKLARGHLRPNATAS